MKMQNDTVHIEARIKDHSRFHSCWKAMASENPEGFKVLQDVLLAPGKRVRPLLFAAACRDFGVEPFPRFSDVALALELAHSFILVHDDLIDRSVKRRGRPTLQCAAEEWFSRVPADGFSGADFALVGGDLLFSLAIESLAQADVPAAIIPQLMRDFMTAAQQTARGAFLEMQASQTPVDELTTDQIEEIYSLKTGCYTFTLPLKFAAACTGSEAAGLEDIGRSAGIAFQLQNDLNSLQLWQETGTLPDDVRDHRRIWPLVYAGSQDMLCSEATRSAVRRAVGIYAEEAFEQLDHLPFTKALIQKFLTKQNAFTAN